MIYYFRHILKIALRNFILCAIAYAFFIFTTEAPPFSRADIIVLIVTYCFLMGASALLQFIGFLVGRKRKCSKCGHEGMIRQYRRHIAAPKFLCPHCGNIEIDY